MMVNAILLIYESIRYNYVKGEDILNSEFQAGPFTPRSVKERWRNGPS
jgi:hypothetical protein